LRDKRTVALFALLVAAGSLVAPTASAADPTLTIDDTSVPVGGTANVTLALNEAPQGIAGFDLNVSLDDGSVAEIERVRIGAGFGSPEGSTEVYDGDTAAYASGIDFERNYEDGARDVRLVVVEIAGVAEGETTLDVTRTNIDNDRGDNVAPALDTGVVAVGQPLPETTTPETTNETTTSGGGLGGGFGGPPSGGPESGTDGETSSAPDGPDGSEPATPTATTAPNGTAPTTDERTAANGTGPEPTASGGNGSVSNEVSGSGGTPGFGVLVALLATVALALRQR
jgi:hypothetical protein